MKCKLLHLPFYFIQIGVSTFNPTNWTKFANIANFIKDGQMANMWQMSHQEYKFVMHMSLNNFFYQI
jgi:hypothetical protein